MRCECGKEILNVPEHLRTVVKWVCKDCGRNIDTKGHIVERPMSVHFGNSYIKVRKAA